MEEFSINDVKVFVLSKEALLKSKSNSAREVDIKDVEFMKGEMYEKL